MKTKLGKKLPMSEVAYTNMYGSKDDQYRICEEFYSIQGEGQLSGTWAYFVRFSECNLRCTWCDTKFSYAKPGVTGEWSTTKQLLRRINETGTKYVVLTGGEPCLQPNLQVLTKTLQENGIHVTIETNSTIQRPDVIPDLWSLSPKLQSAKGVFYELADLVYYVWNQPDPVQLKFVTLNKDDFIEMIKLLDDIEDAHDPTTSRGNGKLTVPVYTQPDGYREDYIEAIRETIEWSKELKKDYDVRPMLQFHRLIWGADSIGV